MSVRAAHLDDTIGFFNGTSVFLAVEGQADAPCVVDIQKPQGAAYRNWRVATALPEARGTKRYGFGAYRAQNYDELIDHPVTLGEFALGSFNAHGVKHDIVISGRVIGLDMSAARGGPEARLRGADRALRADVRRRRRSIAMCS